MKLSTGEIEAIATVVEAARSRVAELRSIPNRDCQDEAQRIEDEIEIVDDIDFVLIG